MDSNAYDNVSNSIYDNLTPKTDEEILEEGLSPFRCVHLQCMDKVELGNVKKVELANVKKVELANVKKVELANMNKVETKRSVLRRQSRDTNRNIKRSVCKVEQG